jgi:hypothetical protein
MEYFVSIENNSPFDFGLLDMETSFVSIENNSPFDFGLLE